VLGHGVGQGGTKGNRLKEATLHHLRKLRKETDKSIMLLPGGAKRRILGADKVG